MTLKIILLTMHDNELGYEIFPNMVEESSFATVFQASQGTCLVGFTYILAWKPNQNFIMCIRGSVFFFLLAIFAIFVLQPKWQCIHRKI
jgi:hypothetical protein